MKLRPRLALTTVAVAIPVALCMGSLHLLIERRAAETALSEYALAYMGAEGRERCEDTPGTWSLESSRFRPAPRGAPPPSSEEAPWERPPPDGPPPERSFGAGRGGPPPPRRESPRLFAYGADLTALNPRAPALDDSLTRAMRQGQDVAGRTLGWGGRDAAHEVLVRMPWGSGPCAFVLVQMPGRPTRGPSSYSPIPTDFWLVPTLLSLVGVLFALGPVVRRLRQLTQEVKVFVRSTYQGPLPVHGDDEISELARAFDEAGREVHAQMALKVEREQTLRAFLQNTTHDVMIPLTVLQGHLAELQRRVAHGEPVEPGTVAAASQEAHYMAALLHNLGAAARLEAGEPGTQRASVDLNALVARCIGRHRPIARQQGVQLEHAVPEPPVHILGDDILIEQAVSNVIYNAVRYNARDGHVAVVLEHMPGALPGFRLRVLDDGPGIPEHELPHLLERHARGDAARSRGPKGHGLGLDIAARVARLHGWSLKLGPSEYGGLQVDFTGEASAPGQSTP